jgi:hypothetical protein
MKIIIVIVLFFFVVLHSFGQEDSSVITPLYLRDKIIHSHDTISADEAKTICCLGFGIYSKEDYITCEVFGFEFQLIEGRDTINFLANKPTFTHPMQERLRKIKIFSVLYLNVIRGDCLEGYPIMPASYVKVFIKPS